MLKMFQLLKNGLEILLVLICIGIHCDCYKIMNILVITFENSCFVNDVKSYLSHSQ